MEFVFLNCLSNLLAIWLLFQFYSLGEDKKYYESLFYFPVQVAKDPYHRAYFTQEFIAELFAKYCQTWQYSEQKSKKKVYVFTRSCKPSHDYEWCVVVQIPKLYKASFQVVLSKKNTKKLNSRDIVFQCHFMAPSFEEFRDTDLLSSWKTNAIFRCHYIKRHLEYI